MATKAAGSLDHRGERLDEALFRNHASDGDWLRGVAEALLPLLDRGQGLVALLGTLVEAGWRSQALVAVGGCPPQLPARLERQLLAVPRRLRPAFQRQPLAWDLGAAPGEPRSTVLLIGGEDSTRCFWLLAVPLPQAGERHLPAALRQIAPRLDEGLRTRRALGRLRRRQPELAGDGPSSRVALRRLVRELCAGGPCAEVEVEPLWQALLAGELGLVDRFTVDGREYLVAHRPAGDGARRSEPGVRAEQVVSLAAQGLGNKAIAHQLGLAPSTVASHLQRAAVRLGVRGRVALIQAWRRHGGRLPDAAAAPADRPTRRSP